MDDQEIRIEIPEPHYTLFNVKREELPEVLVINDALLRFTHPEIFPWHLRVSMEAVELIENGMPAPDESELLFDIGDEIEEALAQARTAHDAENALFLCRSTWNAIRELEFLVHDPEIAHLALQELLESREWPREWSYEMREDPEWNEAARLFQLFSGEQSSH